MPRDDFSARTKDILAKRVGYRCSNPKCGRVTIGPNGLFSWRAWGDLMAAAWSEKENTNYLYLDFYM